MCFKSFFSTDVTKHAVLGKINEIRPGVYREYMRDVCEKVRGIARVHLKTLNSSLPFLIKSIPIGLMRCKNISSRTWNFGPYI